MNRFLLILLFVFGIAHVSLYGQGTLRGQITDTNGESLIGASVFLKNKPSVGTVTDYDGNYSIHIPDSLPQIIVVSSVSFKQYEEEISLHHNEVVTRNLIMKPDTREMKEVNVSAKAVRAKEYYIENIRRNASVTLDFVSAETMKKTGDANVTAAVARISGVSTNGNFITVRGIGDRYIKTAVNGLRIPTLDPFTNNIKLDLFPASLVDNITVTKTGSPDLPADWAGAYLSVETKDYPSQLSVNVESAFGYNSQSTFKAVLSSAHASTEWLGYDHSLRTHDQEQFTAINNSPSTYQQFVALGLGNYFNAMGVNGNTPWNDTYMKLGLVQLGLLAPAQFNDQDAFSRAKLQYLDGSYAQTAYNIINANVPSTGKSFANNWNTVYRKAPLNFSQSFSIGNTVQLFGKEIGLLAGFRYNRSTQYDENAFAARAGVVADENQQLVPSVTSALNQQVSRETNGWSGLINMACKFNSNNSVSLLFMPNFNGVNNIRNSIDDRDATSHVITQSQFYEQRKQLVYQLKTDHYLPKLKLKITSSAGYTSGKSDAPDFKNVQYLNDPYSGTYQIGGSIGDGVHRYYRYLGDNLFDGLLSAEFPLGNKPTLQRKLKFGAAYQRNNKKSDQYDYQLYFGDHSSLTLQNNDLNQLFNLSNFEIHSYTDANGQTGSTIDEYYLFTNSPANHTFGKSEVRAAYVMTDYTIRPRIRVSGGLRIEHALIATDVVKYDSLGLAADDPRRDYSQGRFPLVNPGSLNETNLLPSVNFIYKLKNDDSAPFNVRLNYSQAIARPSIRELSDVAVFDYELRSAVFGNSSLKTVHITNYDIRFEDYFKTGDNLSLSFFYKDFRNHIELVKSAGYSWQNVDKSSVAGIEIEGKKKLSAHFEFRCNLTLAQSNTKFVRTRFDLSGGVKNYIAEDTVSRSMFGQAPYIINSMISYQADSLGLGITLSYNVQGSRLVIASDNKEVPDVYELPRNLVDIKITKTLTRHFGVSFTVRDMLNAPVRRAYNYSSGSSLDYDHYSYGTNYLLAFSYKL